MKKVLSVVLVLAMILGSFSMVFASDYSDVKNSDSYSEAVSVLSGLDVIGGYADGTFRPEGVVTRAEMATMIVNALGIPVKGGAATQFSDVPASHWASGYINYAASVGFIAGYTDGTFQPEKQVSYNEAITMLVAALGYTADSLVGTYPGSFINKATSLGILDNCKTTGTTGANRGDIAQMLYDTMDCVIGYVDKDGAFIANVTKVDGVTAYYDTMFARLKCADYNKGDEFVVTGKEKAAISLAPYVGKYVTATKNADNEIISINVVSETYRGKLRADGTLGDYDIKASVSYAKDDTEVTGSTAGIVVFENGGFKEVKADHTGWTGTYTFEVKTSGKYITEIYSASDWTATKKDQIEESDLDELADDDKLLGEAFVMNDNKEIDTDTFILEGVDSLADIKEDHVVYVYCYPANAEHANKIAKVSVGTEVVTGKVTRMNDGDDITVAGKVYEKASGFVGDSPAVGSEYDIYLDFAGDYYKVSKIAGESNYGVLLNVGVDAGRYAGDETAYVKLFAADGTVIEAELDSDITTAAAMSAQGYVVSYEINSKGVLTKFTSGTAITAGAVVNNKGLHDGKEINADTVIFKYDNTGVSDADSYSVIKMEDVLGQALTSGTAVIDGSYKAMCVVGTFTKADEVYAVFTGEWAREDNGDYDYVVTTLYDGEIKEFAAADAIKNGLDSTYKTTTASATVFTLTWVDGGIKQVDDTINVNVEATVSASVKTTVTGSIFTDAADKKYALADDIVVFVYDASDDEWTIGTKSSLAGAADTFDKIYLYDAEAGTSSDDSHDIYDLALVFKK